MRSQPFQVNPGSYCYLTQQQREYHVSRGTSIGFTKVFQYTQIYFLLGLYVSGALSVFDEYLYTMLNFICMITPYILCEESLI